MAFDAELYLRLRGEELVIGGAGDARSDGSPLASAAAALVAVGAVPASQAEAVLSDYDTGWAARFRECRPGSQPASQRVGHISLERLAQARIVSLGDELALLAGTVRLRYGVLEPGHTALLADFHVRETSTGLRDWIRVPSGMPSGLPRPELTDETGTVRTLEFNGHGNDDRWSGQFFTDTAIPVDASWMELFGARIALNRPPAPTVVTIETVESHNPAQLHLLRVLASASLFSTQDPFAACDALVAAGAIALEDPVVALINAARTGERDRRTLKHPAGLTDLPAPWPVPRVYPVPPAVGMIITDVVTAEMDGQRVAVLAIRPDRDGFIVEAEVAPSSHRGSDLEDHEVIWWARDDLGQNYLGSWDLPSRHIMSGELKFFPPLNARAQQLDLMPSTPTLRAVITVPLESKASA